MRPNIYKHALVLAIATSFIFFAFEKSGIAVIDDKEHLEISTSNLENLFYIEKSDNSNNVDTSLRTNPKHKKRRLLVD